MSRHISASLFRNYNSKLNLIYSYFGSTHSISTSLPNLSSVQRLSSTTAPDNIQVSKYVQPFINRPVDEILSGVVDKTLSGSESVSVLKALRLHTLFKGASSECFTSDSRFKILCEAFEKNCATLKPVLLVSGLRSLLEVGVPSDSSCVVSAEENILNNIHQFSAFNIIGCLYFHHKYMETDLQKKVVIKLASQLEKRFYEISSSDVLMLVHILHLFDKTFQKRLEQKIIELMAFLDVSELCKLVNVLAEKSNRNLFILNSVAFYLRQKTEKPDLKEIIDLFYVFKKMNFFDPALFAYLLNWLEPEISSIQEVSLITGLLTACGHMRWKHIGILDKCGEWIKNHFDACKSRDFVAYILTVGALDYYSSQVQVILEKIVPILNIEKELSPEVTLNLAWSLGVLNCLSKELLLKILSPKFYKPIIEPSDSQVNITNHLKLLNLKGILKKNYPEGVFGCELHLEPVKLPESSDVQNCRQHVIKILNILIPKKCLAVNQVSDTGVFIDAEFIINENRKPLPIQGFGTASEGLKPVPINSKRFALLVMFQKDYTHWSPGLTGVNMLAINLLKDAGYTVVIVSYDELSRKKTDVEKVKFLSEKLMFRKYPEKLLKT
ncbi:FAST kinase domain-containing protein 4 [Trichonephila clavata]|uniref:FAST kinase domain-containing protein 4 n=1 Tax=Trichonephila clavata TaxID=2740835 RepID=A0A8X6K7V3_TRICU|nr:FAST kinase domain-containing protein 4 [Trichonephila clavata]